VSFSISKNNDSPDRVNLSFSQYDRVDFRVIRPTSAAPLGGYHKTCPPCPAPICSPSRGPGVPPEPCWDSGEGIPGVAPNALRIHPSAPKAPLPPAGCSLDAPSGGIDRALRRASATVGHALRSFRPPVGIAARSIRSTPGRLDRLFLQAAGGDRGPLYWFLWSLAFLLPMLLAALILLA
jgi:hypothetical protein